MQPEFVQIISWNDFGESHYIGPLDDRQYEAFEIGHAEFNYVEDMPHDGWRVHLPWLIDTYKDLNPEVGLESAVMWFRKSPGSSCRDGGTTGNTASQLQIEYPPEDIFQDKIFIAALMTEPAYVQLMDNDNHLYEVVKPDEWPYVPPGGVGIYLVSIDLEEGIRNYGEGSVLMADIYHGGFSDGLTPAVPVMPDDTCSLGLANWNAIVGADYSDRPPRTEKALRLSDQMCVEGYGATHFGNFNDLCQLTCQYGYVSCLAISPSNDPRSRLTQRLLQHSAQSVHASAPRWASQNTYRSAQGLGLNVTRLMAT